MKTRNTVAFCSLVLLYLSACQSEQTSEKESASGPSVYSIDVNAKSVDFLDQIESISVFGFEEAAESLLKPSSFFFEYEKGVVVVNESAGDVFVFNKKGSFVRKFNRKGGGPEEYDEMANTVYRDGFIETYNFSKQRVARYDLEGNFLGETKLPYRAMNVFFNKDRYLLGMGRQPLNDSTNYNMIFLDADGNEYGKTIPFDTEVPFPITTAINTFSELNGQVLFGEILTDSVVLVGEKDVTTYVKFDFGDQWFWTEEMFANGNKAMDLINSAQKVWIYHWVMGADRVEVTYNTSFSDFRRGFIDRASGEFLHYDYPSWGEEIPSIRNVRFEGDELVVTIMPDVLEVLVEKLGEGRYEIEGGQSLESLLQSENPVVAHFRFKEE